MQAVILAAGQGKRLRPLTDKIPKGMIEIAGRKIIEHNVYALPPEIDEVIIVIGHLGNKIIKHFKNKFANKKIRYIWQKKLLGTAHALRLCKKYLGNRFLVLMGDNVYFKNDIRECLKFKRCILVKKEKGDFLSVVRNKFGNFIGLKKVVGNGFMNTGLYILNKNYFNYSMVKLQDGEFGLPQTMTDLAEDYPIKVVLAKKWIQINDSKDLEIANILLNHKF